MYTKIKFSLYKKRELKKTTRYILKPFKKNPKTTQSITPTLAFFSYPVIPAEKIPPIHQQKKQISSLETKKLENTGKMIY